MPAKIVLTREDTGGFRYRVLASNGKPIATSQAYGNKAAATRAVESLRKAAAEAALDDQTSTTSDSNGARAARTPRPAPTKTATKTATKARTSGTSSAGPSTRASRSATRPPARRARTTRTSGPVDLAEGAAQAQPDGAADLSIGAADSTSVELDTQSRPAAAATKGKKGKKAAGKSTAKAKKGKGKKS